MGATYTPRSAAGTVAQININATVATAARLSISAGWTDVPGIEGIQPFGSAKGIIDVTPLSETQAKQFVDDVPDPGELAFSSFSDLENDVHQYLQYQANNVGGIDEWRVKPHLRSKMYHMNAFVTECKPSFAKSKGQMFDVKAKITGAVTVVDAS